MATLHMLLFLVLFGISLVIVIVSLFLILLMILLLLLLLLKPLRIFNTWMGDQSKLLFLKEVVRIIREEELLERARDTGEFLLNGLTQLEVLCVSR